MAKLTSTTLFFLLATFVGCVFALPLLQRDVNLLEHDLELVSGDTSILYNTIAPLNSPNSYVVSPDAESLPSQFELTNKDLQRCADDLNEISSINSVDAAIVLKIIEDFRPKMVGVLANLRRKKAFFEGQRMTSVILEQLKALQSGMGSLLGKLAKALPTQFQGEAQSIQANMGVEFYATISIYSSK